MVWKDCERHAPGSGPIMVNSILFLRFFCPSLTDPKKFGLISSEIDATSIRCLIPLLKVLQNISTGVEFDGSKEAYMKVMNEEVNKYHPLLCKRVKEILHSTTVRRPAKKIQIGPTSSEGQQLLVLKLFEHRQALYQSSSPSLQSMWERLFPELAPQQKRKSTSGVERQRRMGAQSLTHNSVKEYTEVTRNIRNEMMV